MYRLLVDLAQPTPLLLLAAMVVLVRLWRRQPESRRAVRWVALSLALLAVLSLPAVGYFAAGSLEWQYPPLARRPPDADAIVVLAGYIRLLDESGETVELGTDTLYRCLKARELYRQGPPCPVILCGGKVDPSAPGPSLAAAMRDFLVGTGVRPEDVVLEDDSRTTAENAANCAVVLRDRGLYRPVLVTDASHLPRAVGCFRHQGVDVVPCGCRHAALQFVWSPANFIPNPAAAAGIMYAWHEWLGLGWYRVRGLL